MQAHGRIWQELTWSWAYSTGHPASDRRLEAEEFVHRRDREDFPQGGAFEGKTQLEVIYGHLAEVMLSRPATKIYLKTAEPKAAK